MAFNGENGLMPRPFIGPPFPAACFPPTLLLKTKACEVCLAFFHFGFGAAF